MRNEKTLEERKKEMDAAMASIRKELGKESIMRLGDASSLIEVETFSSGSLGLDVALGGGIARGRIVEVFGPESSGKTTLALHMIAEVQRAGGLAGFIDAEHALDPVYAQAIGVDLDELYFSQPDSGEQAIEVLKRMIATGDLDVVVVDSVAALTPKCEIDGDISDANVGAHARLMSKSMRVICGAASKANCTVVFINQLREKVGVMYGSPEVTTGGKALKFYASQRIDVRKRETLKSDGSATANRTRAKVVKNKIAPPFKEAEFEITFGRGINRLAELVDAALALGIVVRSGAWFSYRDGDREVKVQGLEGFRDAVADDVELCDSLYDAIEAQMSAKKRTRAAEEPAEAEFEDGCE